MTKTMRRTAAALLLLLAAPLAPLSSAATDVTITQISSNSIEDGKARVAGNLVVWQRNGNTTGEIIRWTPSGGTVGITSNSFPDFDPELSSAFVIWKRGSGASCSLQTWDTASQDTEQLVSAFECDDDISVAGPHIGYIDDGAGFFNDVFVVTDLNDPDQLGLTDVEEELVRVGNVSGNPRAVWFDEDDLVYWNGGNTETVLAERPNTLTLRRQLRMDGDRAVWVDEVGGDTEIFLSNGTSVQQLTNNAFDDESPSIRGDDVVWVGFPDSASEGEIFHYDGTTTEPLTDDDLDDFDPHVSTSPDGATIAWVKTDGDDEIWVFDGCESTQITDNAQDDHDVRIDGNRLAWVRGTGTASEIFTATAECDLVCGDNIVSGDEECDDDNTVSGDGCSEICQIEVCGNSRIDFGEDCDFGDTVNEDGCDFECHFECGNGMPNTGEECDDGDRDDGDSCDSDCRVEVCGNGPPAQINEQCDDGNTVSDDGCSATCIREPAADPATQRCINKMNASGAAVAKAQHAVNLLCLSAAAKGTLPALGVPTAQQCLTDDPKNKVGKATAKTLSVHAAKCASLAPALVPNFAYTTPADVNTAGVEEPLELVADILGPDLDLVVIAKAADPVGARCQKNVLTATQGLSDRLFKMAIKQKKALIAGLPDGTVARSNDVLQGLLVEFLVADEAGKIAAQEGAVRSAVRTSCNLTTLDAAFPGCAPSATFNELATCGISNARCRFCDGFNRYDGLTIDCDAFDDGLANASCP